MHTACIVEYCACVCVRVCMCVCVCARARVCMCECLSLSIFSLSLSLSLCISLCLSLSADFTICTNKTIKVGSRRVGREKEGDVVLVKQVNWYRFTLSKTVESAVLLLLSWRVCPLCRNLYLCCSKASKLGIYYLE
jgi:hypothetical protein